jgi:hypothetical protein
MFDRWMYSFFGAIDAIFEKIDSIIFKKKKGKKR